MPAYWAPWPGKSSASGRPARAAGSAPPARRSERLLAARAGGAAAEREGPPPTLQGVGDVAQRELRAALQMRGERFALRVERGLRARREQQQLRGSRRSRVRLRRSRRLFE